MNRRLGYFRQQSGPWRNVYRRALYPAGLFAMDWLKNAKKHQE
jgi:hypothetical protein